MRCRAVVLALSASLLLCVSTCARIADAIPYCRATALGDLDGDGDLDAFLANGRHEGVEPNTVWLNDSRGRFSDSGQRLGRNDSHAAAIGDLDGDGDLDVLLGNTWAPPGGEVLENDGQGRFTSRQWLGEPDGLGGIRAVVLGDLDGDGDVDVFMATCCSGGSQEPEGRAEVLLPSFHRVWLNDGAGSFHDNRQRLGKLGSYGAALGDLDGDGDLDAFVANSPGKPETVWLNDGLGQFADSGQRLGDLRGLATALGDLDGDGDLDALVGNDGPDEVWLNNGTGSFANSGQALGDTRTWQAALGDVDSDGDLDALVERQAAAEFWLNDGAGRFSHGRQTLRPLFLRAVALGDVDGDGDPDIVAGSARGSPRVWLNDGRGRFVLQDLPWAWAGLGVVAIAAVALWWFRRQRQRRHPEPAVG
jgi:hypothetical protein